uniref:Uncharacterized protein n=1 Tax=Arundo donax TaxID=35708 RepID=A0A0A9CIF1_ARUDO
MGGGELDAAMGAAWVRHQRVPGACPAEGVARGKTCFPMLKRTLDIAKLKSFY